MEKESKYSEEEAVWYSRASKVLRGEMIRNDVTTERLSELLQEAGIKIGVPSLNRKLLRGAFSFVFVLQCMKVMGIKTIDLYMAQSSSCRPTVTKSSGEPLDGKSLKLIDEDESPTG